MPPAARITDMHVCPAVTVLVPHVGGPIIPPCAPTVVTGFLPQARVTDLLTCVGPPDVIQQGSATVIVAQLPAARLTDPTVHGGVIVTGCPTVIIGGPAASAVMRGNITVIVDRVNHTITLVGTQEFSGTGASQDYADRASQMINSAWSGPTQFEGQNYQVTANISGRFRPPGAPPTPGTNQVDVVQTAQPFAVTSQQDPSNQPFYAATPGHQHSTDMDGPQLTVAHEFGHSMGLPDEYTEGPRNPDGTRNVVRTGPPNGLMGYINPAARPTADNFNSLVTGNGLH
jgi:uncharacterized Zn-binding protein involved in type VI secretion